MNDPIYTFKKGEGWVPTTETCRSFICTDFVGHKVLLLDRMPNIGERGFAYYEHERGTWFDKNGVKFETAAAHVAKFDVYSFSPRHSDLWTSEMLGVTVIPLDNI